MSSLVRTVRSLVPDTTTSLIYTYSYKVVIDDDDFTSSPNTLVVMTTLFIVLLMLNELVEITRSIRIEIEKAIETRPITPESEPYFPELIYMGVYAVESALQNGFNLAKGFFGSILAVLLTNIQPDTGSVSLVYRLLVTGLVFTYFFFVLYGMGIIR